MNGSYIILAVACIVGGAFAYTCRKKSCSFGFCDLETTCEVNGTNGCEKSTVNGQLAIAYECSTEPCLPVFAEYSELLVTKDCCFSENCNTDSLSSTVDNPNVDECYSVICDSGVDCISEAITNGNARLCPMPDGGVCATVLTFGDTITNIATCHDDVSNCTNLATYDMSNGSGVVMHCCETDRCNYGTDQKLPGVDYCYATQCYSNGTGCIETAISNGVFVYCAQTGFGCQTEEFFGTYITGCALAPCDSSEEECCFGDLCNGGTGKASTVITSSTTEAVATDTTTKSAASRTGKTSHGITESSAPSTGSTSHRTSESTEEATTKKRDTSGATGLRYFPGLILAISLVLTYND